MGTFDSSVFIPYLVEYIPPQLIDKAVDFSKENAGFDLWKTDDGIQWYQISKNGFGNPFNYGVRTFTSASAGLFVGTANPFKDKDPLTGDPRAGGLEIWLGK